MNTTKFKKYLLTLGYADESISANLKDRVFVHSLNAGGKMVNVKYILTSNQQEIFETHKLLWNQNADATFIAVGEYKSHIINAKIKPDKDNPLRKGICLESFNYGINSEGYEDADIEKIKKDYINSTYFFEFVRKRQTTKLKKEVDKDLLLNLLHLRSDMLEEDTEQVVHLLILRCLFVKYLEDRGIFDKNFLVSILQSGNPEVLIGAFNEVCKINGDVFGGVHLGANDINPRSLQFLARFFTCDYQTGQGSLFPYEFDHIPIQLISHVYEAFLKSDTKKGKGVYYTPPFVVDFMLSQTLKKLIKKDNKITILDPAVGSAAFLVESFKIVQDTYGENIDFEKKKWILENQLFGIDVDENALQIAAFSLYLALLETEKADFIKEQIEIASPILPKLIGKTLIKTNAITDNPFEGRYFGLIVSNPPWGSIPTDGKSEHLAEREAIDNKDKKYPEYANVADYERSQAFLMRVAQWGNENTIYALIVKNSIFLNNGTAEFRKDFLNRYKLNKYFDLSFYNKILFKKKPIGVLKGERIEVGATEPAAILIYRTAISHLDQQDNIEYVAPKLTSFAEYLDIIQIAQEDVTVLPQQKFVDCNNYIWKVLVNTDSEGLALIEKLLDTGHQDIEIESGRGFEPKKNGKVFGNPEYKKWIDIDCFDRFKIKKLKEYNWNQEFRNKRDEIFETENIVFARRPLERHENRLTAVKIDSGVVFKDNLVYIKINRSKSPVESLDPYIGILNSSLIGFLVNQMSVQWGKGNQKIASLRTKDIEKVPFPLITNEKSDSLANIIWSIKDVHDNPESIAKSENDLDEIVFDLYNLLEYEKEIIREFYQVNVARSREKDSLVRATDMETYFNAFKNTFSLVLSPKSSLNASFHISSNVGAIMCISIVDKNEKETLNDNPELQILNYVKTKQLGDTETTKILNEEKVKIYEKTRFYIIKSKYFKDWTVRQGMKDAKEEIQKFLEQLT